MFQKRIELKKEGRNLVTLWQDHLDGIQALIHWLDGYQSRHGEVIGAHELLAHYRSLDPLPYEPKEEKG